MTLIDSDFGRLARLSFAPLQPESFTQASAKRASVTPAKVSSLNLAWDYSDWTSLNGKSFPSEMQMTLVSGTDTNTVRFKLSSVQADEQLSVTPFPTPDSNSYTHINITRLFKRLMQ